ncbi:ROK family protein [Brevibacillus sp. B_LB10_24]|uniref:ROK family protein n=1 Tax=Brevibacillus sp. B_LB10_24 TaxID=3380645 RepID=UPI0038BD563C
MLRQFIGVMSPKLKSLKLLYSLIRKLGPVRINKLVEITGYKHTTCARLLDELVQAGIICDSGLGESSGGRKPLMYVIKQDAYYLIGVEISSLFTTVTLLDLNLNLLEVKTLRMNSHSTAEATLEFICEHIQRMLETYQITNEKLLGIGVGAIGLINPEHGSIIHRHLPSSQGWADTNISQYIQHRFNTLVLMGSGISLAALGEFRKNRQEDIETLVFTSAGLEIRCGIVSQGQIVSSKNKMEDSFGHITVDVHGRKCSCGSYGCLQTYSSLPAIRDEVIRRIKRGYPSLLEEMVPNIEDVEFHHILNALEQNDPLTYEVIREAAYYFGIGLSNVLYLISPDIVIFGGPFSSNLVFREIVSETVHKRTGHYPDSNVKILQSVSGHHAVAVGAGCMILDYFVE